LRILSAIDIKFSELTTYTYGEVSNLLKAIRVLKKEDPNFEMYVMLGAWMIVKNAWTELSPIHSEESEKCY
jgi:hypothetical protein